MKRICSWYYLIKSMLISSLWIITKTWLIWSAMTFTSRQTTIRWFETINQSSLQVSMHHVTIRLQQTGCKLFLREWDYFTVRCWFKEGEWCQERTNVKCVFNVMIWRKFSLIEEFNLQWHSSTVRWVFEIHLKERIAHLLIHAEAPVNFHGKEIKRNRLKTPLLFEGPIFPLFKNRLKSRLKSGKFPSNHLILLFWQI